VWALLLLVIAIAIVVLEMFIPSGGLLAIMAAASLLGSIIIVFKHYGMFWGTAYLVFNAVLTPFVIMAALRWWPHTPIGRKMLNLPPGEKDDITSIPSFDKYKQLIGKQGTAESKMLPSGTIRIDNRTHDAVAQGMAIDPGQTIVVVAVEGNRIIVRPTFADEERPAPTAGQPADEAANSQPAEALEQTFPDPFDDSAEGRQP
jgi:membrane-bound ClpP family serine protease